MPFSTKDIFDNDFSDSHWQRTFQLLVKLHEKYDSAIATDDWSALKERSASYRNINPNYFHFVTLHDNDVVGWLNGEVRKGPDGKTVAFCRFDTLYEDPPPDYATATAAALADIVGRSDCSTLYFMAANQRTARLADSWSATRFCRLDRYRLFRSKANYDVINSWLEEYPRRFPELKAVLMETVPDNLIDDYIELWRSFVEDMPKEGELSIPFTLTKEEWRRREVWRRTGGQHMYVIALVNEKGRMIGHTNGFISEQNPTEMYQAMTGIAASYRGKGLSKWLKATLFTKVGEDFPNNEYLVTDMRAVNEPIHAVNTQMGFELISQGFEYLISLDHLKAAAA